MDLTEALKIIISGTIGTLAFSMIFRANKKRVFCNCIGGAITCAVYVLLCANTDNMFMQNLFPALFATAFAEVMARVMKAPATPILACSIIPLVPGGKLYYTTYYFVTSEMDKFHETFMETINIAAGLAVGIICISVIVHEINHHKYKNILDRD